MSSDLLKLIHEYQLAVHGLVTTFQQRFGTDDLLAARRRGDIPAQGTLDDRHETRYRFHGIGIHCEGERGEVDFDFGPLGRYDGFDGWRLWIYAQSRAKEYPQFQRHEVVESVLGELVTDGLVIRPRWSPGPHLCYLRDSKSGDTPPAPERKPERIDLDRLSDGEA